MTVYGVGVMKLCAMEVDLRTIRPELFEKRQNSQGEEYYKIACINKVIATSASLLFELEFNGVSYGRVRSKY
jgi:hypothetical protein